MYNCDVSPIFVPENLLCPMRTTIFVRGFGLITVEGEVLLFIIWLASRCWTLPAPSLDNKNLLVFVSGGRWSALCARADVWQLCLYAQKTLGPMNSFDLLPEPPHNGHLQHQRAGDQDCCPFEWLHTVNSTSPCKPVGHTGSFWEETAGVTVM